MPGHSKRSMVCERGSGGGGGAGKRLEGNEGNTWKNYMWHNCRCRWTTAIIRNV